MIRFPCPNCGTTIEVSDNTAGKTGKCQCGERIRIPSASPPDEPWYQLPRPTPSPHDPPALPRPMEREPRGELILCYVCKKQVANTALVCPHCGAVQTREGKARGARLNKMGKIVTAIIVTLLALPLFACCLGVVIGGHSPKTDSADDPPRWDMEKLKRDADEAAHDPNKTILIPSDGSQPVVVPNPDAPHDP